MPSIYSPPCVRLWLRVSQNDAKYLAGFKDDIAIRNYRALSLKREIAMEILSKFTLVDNSVHNHYGGDLGERKGGKRVGPFTEPSGKQFGWSRHKQKELSTYYLFPFLRVQSH